MKYVIVERSYEYNDEYNVFNEDGYTIKSKLFNTPEEAKEGLKPLILNLFKDYKGNFKSNNLDFKMFDSWSESEAIQKYFKSKGYPVDEDDYQLFLPEGLTEEECLEAYKNWGISLFNIIKIEE